MLRKGAWAAGVRPTFAREVLSALSAAGAVGLMAGLGAAAVAARMNPSLRDAQDATRFLLASAGVYVLLFLPLGLFGLLCVRWVGFRPRPKAPPHEPRPDDATETPKEANGSREPQQKSRFPFSTHAAVMLTGAGAYAVAVLVGARVAQLSEDDVVMLGVAAGVVLLAIALAAYVVTRKLFQGLIGTRRWLIPILLVFSCGLFLLLGIGGGEAEESHHVVEPTVLGGPSEAPAPRDPVLAALPVPKQRRVVLLALDGADWEHIDALIAVGELPSFRRLLARGVRTSLRGERPAWSPVAWTTAATGVQPDVHGVCDVTEVVFPGLARGLQRVYARRGEPPMLPPAVGLRPLVDRALDRLLQAGLVEERLVSSDQRRSKAIWNILAERGLPVAVVRWPASRPAEALYGWVIANDDPWTGDLRLREARGAATSTAGLFSPAELREELADLLASSRTVAGLGAGGSDPLPRPSRSDAKGDQGPSGAPPQLPIFEHLSEQERALLEREPQLRMEAREVLAADAFGARAALRLWRERRPWFLALCLRGLDVLGHRLERVPGAIDGTYRWMDQALGAWLEAAGDEATVVVVSAYGGAQAGGEHAPRGILVLSGANVRAGVEFAEAPSIYDLAPTLLALYGLPPSREMTGRVLVEALDIETPPGENMRPQSYGRYSARIEPEPEPAVSETATAPQAGG